MPNYRSLVSGGFFSSDPYGKGVPVSIRCNNPGAVNGAKWEEAEPGFIATVETTPGNKTTIFEAPEYGVAVWYKLLQKYRAAGATTVEEIIKRYGGGQDYSAYVDFAVKQSGLTRSAVVDLADDASLLKFARVMFHYEAGRTSPLSDAQILFGFRLARGAAPPVAAAAPSFWAALIAAFVGLFFRKAAQPSAKLEPPWMTKARSYVGFVETPGNRGIEEFIRLARHGQLGDPWCAIFVNACLEEVGVKGTRSAMARSFEGHPDFVRLAGPAVGAIVTLWRGSPASGSGHVTFYDGEDAQSFFGVGGNQDDGVRRQREPFARITGYWWPRAVAQPVTGKVLATAGAVTAGSET